MLPLKDKDRVRVLAGVARKGATWQVTRVTVVTLSLAILVIVPLSKLVRIDLWGGEHYLLGERVTTVKALGGFIVSMAILYGATFLSNMIVGRFFCGWGCPVGYVSRLGEGVQ
ncbi:MAG: 4Fe-4S binding protein, partial [Planctomycetes bacterium]|nr:4Fe-4S binding protein [Planctomycetota bacterium]